MNIEAMSLQDFRDRLQQQCKGVPGQDLPDEERVRRAKQMFMKKLNGRRAVDLDSCLQCGMCAEACHFYEATQNEKYTSTGCCADFIAAKSARCAGSIAHLRATFQQRTSRSGDISCMTRARVVGAAT